MKTVRVGILSASLGHIPNSFLLPTRQALENIAGRNTGNLAFRHAVAQHIASPHVHVPWGADPGWVRTVCDLLVIPSANQANPGMDFGPRADFLEAVDLPCLALGLGAQAPHLGAEVTFPRGTLRYLRALSQRSRQIGIRGEYTAEVLAKIGVNNTVVIGCPSHFINPLPTLGAVIERKLRHGALQHVAVTAGDLAPAHRKLERKLFNWVLRLGGAYICQSHVGLVALARNRLDEITIAEVDQIRRYLQRRSARFRPRVKFLAAARQRFRVFFDAGAWLEFLTRFDLVIGSRIHGNLLAVQAGTPGICIHHDSRMLELCRTTGMPNVSLKDFLSARRFRALFDSIPFHGGDFDRNRTARAREYRTLLAQSNVQISDELTRLTDATPTDAPQPADRSPVRAADV